MPHPRITLLAGPTASGKSRLALEWAERRGAVILNADSQQLYGDLRILTARPTLADEARAEHRLYGVADAAEAWSVGRWTRAVMAELEQLGGRPALIVGGTGLYFSALTRGLADIPDVPASERDAAASVFDADGEPALRRRLRDGDPVSEAAIKPGDRQRLVRALAVLTHTGRPLSRWVAETRPLLSQGDYDAWVLEPAREALYAACDARVEAMVEAGALVEVEGLLRRRLDPELPAMKAVGVREFAEVIRGTTELTAAVGRVQQATRNYAKRQLTWFRNQTPDWPRRPITGN